MHDAAHTVIGYIVDVQGNALSATLVEDEQGHAPTVTIGDEDIVVGRIGSYVAIRQNTVNIIAMVTRMTEQEVLADPTIETPGEKSARLPFAKRLARLTPIGSLDPDGRFERGVGQYPTTGAEVHAIGSAEIKKMFARFHAEGFEVGALTTHPSIKVSLHATNLFGRHLAILGQTGSGKSWTVASVIQKAVAEMPKAHIIILDLHGEYCWKREDESRHYAFDEAVVRHVDARDLEIPYWLMTYAELCDLLIEHSEREATNQTAPLDLPRVTVDTPIHFSLDELLDKVRAKNVERVGARDKQGPMFGNFDRFLMRIESKLNDSRYDFLLKPQVRTSSASLSGLLRDFVGLGDRKVQVTVIDLSSVPFDVRPTVAAQIGIRSTVNFRSFSCARKHTRTSRAQARASLQARASRWSALQRKGGNTVSDWRSLASVRTRSQKLCSPNAGHLCACESRTRTIRRTFGSLCQRAKVIW